MKKEITWGKVRENRKSVEGQDREPYTILKTWKGEEYKE